MQRDVTCERDDIRSAYRLRFLRTQARASGTPLSIEMIVDSFAAQVDRLETVKLNAQQKLAKKQIWVSQTLYSRTLWSRIFLFNFFFKG